MGNSFPHSARQTDRTIERGVRSRDGDFVVSTNKGGNRAAVNVFDPTHTFARCRGSREYWANAHAACCAVERGEPVEAVAAHFNLRNPVILASLRDLATKTASAGYRAPKARLSKAMAAVCEGQGVEDVIKGHNLVHEKDIEELRKLLQELEMGEPYKRELLRSEIELSLRFESQRA
jgi:hypothetical protein